MEFEDNQFERDGNGGFTEKVAEVNADPKTLLEHFHQKLTNFLLESKEFLTREEIKNLLVKLNEEYKEKGIELSLEEPGDNPEIVKINITPTQGQPLTLELSILDLKETEFEKTITTQITKIESLNNTMKMFSEAEKQAISLTKAK
jgi:hypothetical protein